jgi:magnesium transporter
MVAWHRITNPDDPELDRLAAEYNIHPLHIEDCRQGNENAKLEENEGYLFAVLKPVDVSSDHSVLPSDLDVFVGQDFVITVERDCHQKVRDHLSALQKQIPSLRPDQIFHRILDGVVDAYFPILDHFDDAIDEMEDRVLGDVSPQVLSEIFDIKRSLIQVRRVLIPTRDALARIQRGNQPFIQADMWPYFRDVYDHVVRDLDMVETQRDLLTGSLDIYLSSVANRTNQVMKVLTVLGTLALPSLVISGLFGMNVKGLPAVDSPHGFIFVILSMLAVTVVLLTFLKRFGWW